MIVYLVVYERANNEQDEWMGVEGVYATEERAEQAIEEIKALPEARNVIFSDYWVDEFELVE